MNHCFYFACELLIGPPMVPSTVKRRESCERKQDSEWLLLLNKGQNEKWELITCISLWCELSTVHFLQFYTYYMNFVALSSKYNSLFVMNNKPFNMILTHCSEPLRVTREEVAGLTYSSYALILSILHLHSGGAQLSVMDHPADIKYTVSQEGRLFVAWV